MGKRGLLQRSHSGFTLIEIVIALALFAVISTAVYSSLSAFLKSRDKIVLLQDRMQQLDNTYQLMRRDLANVVNTLLRDEYGDPMEKNFIIDESETVMAFNTLVNDPYVDQLGVPRRVEWKLIEQQLKRVIYPVADPTGSTKVSHLPLIKGVTDIEVKLHYYDKDKAKSEFEWKAIDHLPLMAEVNITLEKGLSYSWYFELSQSIPAS